MKRVLDSVGEKIQLAVQRRPANLVVPEHLPRLVAVSKLKPTSAIIEAYENGQRTFGENYIQELVIKSRSLDIVEKCPEIKFHFIGHLQSNKVNKLLEVRNLSVVESVDSQKLANLIDKSIERYQTKGRESGEDDKCDWCFPRGQKMKMMIQVNTSGEDQKSGVEPEQAADLATYIFHKCEWLNLVGFMTIGKFDEWGGGQNLDFSRLYEVRGNVANILGIDPRTLELSMGMSNNFEEAIRMGSTNVRVGSMIFGKRPQKQS